MIIIILLSFVRPRFGDCPSQKDRTRIISAKEQTSSDMNDDKKKEEEEEEEEGEKSLSLFTGLCGEKEERRRRRSI